MERRLRDLEGKESQWEEEIPGRILGKLQEDFLHLAGTQQMSSHNPELSRGGGRGMASDGHCGAEESTGSHPKCAESPATGVLQRRGRTLHPQAAAERPRLWRSSSPSTVGMHAESSAFFVTHTNASLSEGMSPTQGTGEKSELRKLVEMATHLGFQVVKPVEDGLVIVSDQYPPWVRM